jgi:hypothetical protein
VISLFVVLLAPARAPAQDPPRYGHSLELGPGRDEGKILIVSLFSQGSPLAEWVHFDVHVGEIQRIARARLEASRTERHLADSEGGRIERFVFYGADIVVGHRGKNPHILAIAGRTYFQDRTHRLASHWNYHWALQFGYDGETFGTFVRVHHWSNGQEVTASDHTNLGEDFGTVGVEFFW